MSRVAVIGRGSPERGGIPTFLDQLVAGVPGHEIVFVNLARPDVREGGRFSTRNATRTLHDLARVWRAAGDADVAHLHTALSATSTILRATALTIACRMRRTPVIVHAHGGKLLEWLTPRRRPLLRIALRPATRVVAVSDGLFAALEAAVPAGRLVIVRNGVETEVFRPPTARATSGLPVVLFVGGLTRRKGVLDLIEASRTARERGAAHRLVLVGGEPDEGGDELSIVHDAAADGGVELRGVLPREQLAEEYRAADIFCLPSWWEAAPLSVLEAMASGLPVIATSVGDVPAFVEDGRSGRLVAARDPQALAEAIVEVLDDAGRRHEWGAHGRARVEEHFSLEATRRTMAELYADPRNAPGDPRT